MLFVCLFLSPTLPGNVQKRRFTCSVSGWCAEACQVRSRAAPSPEHGALRTRLGCCGSQPGSSAQVTCPPHRSSDTSSSHAAAVPGWELPAGTVQPALSSLGGSRGEPKSRRLPALRGAQLHQLGLLSGAVHPSTAETPPAHTARGLARHAWLRWSVAAPQLLSEGVCWAHSMSGGQHIML